MLSVAVNEILDQLPVSELEASLESFLAPLLEGVPDARLRRVIPLAVRGILGSESPVVTQMAQAVANDEGRTWASAKRFYRLLGNERLSSQAWIAGLARLAQSQVGQERPTYLVVALDPVNLEKPYTDALEGVSTVHKSTPPQMNGQARLTRGYPSITASVVNTQVPVTVYAHWFSYTSGFVSQNHEIQAALDAVRAAWPAQRRRYVLDAGFDDQRWFAELSQEEFVLRLSHLERLVEVYNDRLDRWEEEALGDLVAVTPFTHRLAVRFTHARRTRLAQIQLGWFLVRHPQTHQKLWVLVAHEAASKGHPARTLVLLTNVPLDTIQRVVSVYRDWRRRSRIEHGYRFDQEQGLDVEDMRVQTLPRMQRLFILVLVAAQFVFYLMETWPQPAILWLRYLGGKLGLANDLDGPYLLLRGLAALLQTLTTLAFVSRHPFPHHEFT